MRLPTGVEAKGQMRFVRPEGPMSRTEPGPSLGRDCVGVHLQPISDRARLATIFRTRARYGRSAAGRRYWLAQHSQHGG
jgi:hypothetical protein